MSHQKKAIILVSGGIDSTTVLAMAKKQGFELYALSFYYGQRHKIEVEKVKQIIQRFKVNNHQVINIDLTIFKGSALTDQNLTIPEFSNINEIKNEVPITYVPARNTIFLSYALAFLEAIGGDSIFIGVHTDDTPYPDCQPEYIKCFEQLANLATAIGKKTHNIKICAPLIGMTKSQIITKGIELGVDYGMTISCYNPTDNGLSCGKCGSCTLRLNSFKKLNLTDPAEYEQST